MIRSEAWEGRRSRDRNSLSLPQPQNSAQKRSADNIWERRANNLGGRARFFCQAAARNEEQMKLARFKSDGQIKIGVVRDTAILSLTDRVPGVGADMIAVIERWVELFDQIGSLPPVVDYRLEEVILERFPS
ncbi:hypothetical protein BSL82_04765 [Tardibacter chloracetimidivorans]|uniref:Uncharacterized protein n=1 Tax=Tardibacter chloracetimidivorans TaxID=1921510 RepID=A0A1L3ZSW3_9SPHN|nr:hypothetical protein [Tardibacter chloracetimidivorans]API58708.1 hypothetical protein BSL82_04765 [Tardibacter chloracetimidivorans]